MTFDWDFEFFHAPVRFHQENIKLATYALDKRRNLWRGIVAEAFYKRTPISELGIILMILEYSGDTPSVDSRARLLHYLKSTYIMYALDFQEQFFPIGEFCKLRHVRTSGGNNARILIIKKTGNTVGQMARFRCKYFELYKQCVGILARQLKSYLIAVGLNQFEMDNPGLVYVRNCEDYDRRHFIVCWNGVWSFIL